MKKILLFMWLCCFTISLKAYSIVFVYLGNSFPSYLSDTFFQTRLFNPTCDIFLLANANTLHSYAPTKEFNITPIAVETLIPSKAHRLFANKSTLLKKKKFRNNFWFYASERFFYIDEFMQQHNKNDVFHLEADVLPYVDISTILPIFQNYYPGIAAVLESEEYGTPSFMYFAKKISAQPLAECFAHSAKEA